MKIKDLRTNHIINPLGFKFDTVSFSWITENTTSKFQTSAQIEISLQEDFKVIIFNSGKKEEIDSLSYTPDIKLLKRTRYYWRVSVWADLGDYATSDIAWFETSKLKEKWTGKWITPNLDKDTHPLIRKGFELEPEIVSARAYICGLGLYELQINGERVSEEYFAPGFNSYDFWLQYQTYDVTNLIKSGNNSVGVMLGNGWYKGRFGFDGGYHELYGDKFAVICEIIIKFKNGTTKVIGTDESWKCATSPVKFSGIYDGEIYDANFQIKDWSTNGFNDDIWEKVSLIDLDLDKLTARLSLPVKIKEEIKPVKIIITPIGETVLDMGQNMTGWIRFKANAPKGTELLLQFGEILQKECFYQENLRTAKAEFRYISDGSTKVIQPHFTYYGFRFVKLTNFYGEINIDDFTGCVIYSDIYETGSIKTSNSLVNRLFLNAKWGQKGNFLDVPTDCPQRDERMGWTGDAQIFASTACYNMYSPAFYNKYMFDIHEEQMRLGGSVPFVVPMIKPKGVINWANGSGSAAWGDAATVIPWTLYMHYGDKELLAINFDAMKDWVDYIKKIDDTSGAQRLWKVGFHFADWLALDGKDPSSPFGATDSYYIASAYYCYSAQLVAKAAKVLGKDKISKEYSDLVNEIKLAIQKEYFTPNGRSAINTQTAMIVALYMDLVPESYRQHLIDDLKNQLKENNMHLNTGFVGTAYFCRVLSENGANDYAYKLLLNDDYPSWLYEVKLGATTIWERWNSVLADGSISSTGMNSLNHYAYGAISEWMYRNMCGINPVEEKPGFRKIKLSPKPNGSLKYAKAILNSASGLIESSWTIDDNGTLTFDFTVPFNTEAQIILPDADITKISLNGKRILELDLTASQKLNDVICSVKSGKYSFKYMPLKNYLSKYNVSNTLSELLNDPEAKDIMEEAIPDVINHPFSLNNAINKSITDLNSQGLLSDEMLDKIDKKLRSIHM